MIGYSVILLPTRIKYDTTATTGASQEYIQRGQIIWTDAETKAV